MNDEFYTGIGLMVVWCMKYIFIPIGVGVAIILITRRLLRPQPERQRKNGHKKPFYKVIISQ